MTDEKETNHAFARSLSNDRLEVITTGDIMKYERLEIYPTENGKFVVRTDKGKTFAFDTIKDVCDWLTNTGLKK